MHVVRAALGDDVHHAALAPAVLRLRARGDEGELLDGLEREELQEAADGVVVVVAAVDLVVHVPAVAAVDLRRELGALRRVGVVPEADAGNRHGQVGELPAVERHRLDAARLDHAPDGGVAGLDQRRFTGDRDRFRHRRQLERHVEGHRLGDVDDDALVFVDGERGQLVLDVVGAHGHRREPVEAFAVADVRAHEARRDLARGDRHAGKGALLLVGDAASDVAGRLLRRRRRCRRDDDREQQNHPYGSFHDSHFSLRNVVQAAVGTERNTRRVRPAGIADHPQTDRLKRG